MGQGQRQLATATYSAQVGYGLDFGTTVTGVDQGGKNELDGDFVTSQQLFHFSVTVPWVGSIK